MTIPASHNASMPLCCTLLPVYGIFIVRSASYVEINRLRNTAFFLELRTESSKDICYVIPHVKSFTIAPSVTNDDLLVLLATCLRKKVGITCCR